MAASPDISMKPENRSKDTFLDWFSHVSGEDFANGKAEDLRSFVRSRGQPWFDEICGAYADLHDTHPGGFPIPACQGQRPLCWDAMGTAGRGVAMGGIDERMPFFGPLIYEGIVFTDRISLTSWMLRVESNPTARARFNGFMDVVIDYAPMIRTGQIAIISDRAAYAIASPKHPHMNPWRIEGIDEALLKRAAQGEAVDARVGISALIGYLNLAEAFGADPVISEEYRPVAELLFDYLAQGGYAESTEGVYSRLPELNFEFYFDPDRAHTSRQERATLIAQLSQDKYWVDVRRVVAEAAGEKSRADFNARIVDGIAEIERRRSRTPPVFMRIPTGFAMNYGGNIMFLGSLALLSYAGFDEYRSKIMADNHLAAVLCAAVATVGLGTAAAVFRRFSDRPFVAPDVLKMVVKSVQDPLAQASPNRSIDEFVRQQLSS